MQRVYGNTYFAASICCPCDVDLSAGSDDEATEKWNRRAAPSRNEALRKALEEIVALDPKENHQGNYNDLVAIAAVRIAEAAISRADLEYGK